MKIELIEVGSFLTKSKAFGHVFNPYRGCIHQCKYCYAHYMRDYTQHKEAWGEYVDVKSVKRYSIPKDASRIMLSSVTDPYQAVEAKYLVTRHALEHLLDYQGQLTILTKSKLVTRDIDLFKQIKNIEVGMSITTVDEKFRSIMEPRASLIEERFDALRQLHEAGVTTFIFIAPIMPKLTNYQKIIEQSKSFVDYYMFDTMRLKGENKKWVLDMIKIHAPSLSNLYHQIYNLNDSRYFKLLSSKIEEYCVREEINYKLFF